MEAREYLEKNGYKEGMVWTLDNVERVCEQYYKEKIKGSTKYLIAARIYSWETKVYWYEFDDYNEALKELKRLREDFTSNVVIDFYKAEIIVENLTR